MVAAAPSLQTFVDRVIAAARVGGATELDLATMHPLLVHRREFETLQQAERVAELERVLSAMDAGERRIAICERLGVSKRRFYELRNMASAARDRTGRR